MLSNNQTPLSRGLDDFREYRFRDIVIDLYKVHSLIGKKIDGAARAFRAVNHETLIRPKLEDCRPGAGRKRRAEAR